MTLQEHLQTIAPGQELTFSLPSDDLTIAWAEERLEVPFPPELKAVLKEFNGLIKAYTDIFFSVDRIVKDNLLLRTKETLKPLYMRFDELLFIGEAENGNLFAFSRNMDGTFKTGIFEWNHENDNRILYAEHLQAYLEMRVLER